MIQSPLIDESVTKAKCETTRENLLGYPAGCFGPVPQDFAAALQSIGDKAQLHALVSKAAQCPDLDAFRSRLS
jgi:hypothetical protein